MIEGVMERLTVGTLVMKLIAAYLTLTSLTTR